MPPKKACFDIIFVDRERNNGRKFAAFCFLDLLTHLFESKIASPLRRLTTLIRVGFGHVHFVVFHPPTGAHGVPRILGSIRGLRKPRRARRKLSVYASVREGQITLNECDTRVLDIISQPLEIRIRSLVKDEIIGVSRERQSTGKCADVVQERRRKCDNFLLRIAGKWCRQFSELFRQVLPFVPKTISEHRKSVS